MAIMSDFLRGVEPWVQQYLADPANASEKRWRDLFSGISTTAQALPVQQALQRTVRSESELQAIADIVYQWVSGGGIAAPTGGPVVVAPSSPPRVTTSTVAEYAVMDAKPSQAIAVRYVDVSSNGTRALRADWALASNTVNPSSGQVLRYSGLSASDRAKIDALLAGGSSGGGGGGNALIDSGGAGGGRLWIDATVPSPTDTTPIQAEIPRPQVQPPSVTSRPVMVSDDGSVIVSEIVPGGAVTAPSGGLGGLGMLALAAGAFFVLGGKRRRR